jgi:hypothetical protein
MKYQYIVDESGNILHKYEGDQIKFGGPWQYAQRIESSIKDGVPTVKDGEIKIVEKKKKKD